MSKRSQKKSPSKPSPAVRAATDKIAETSTRAAQMHRDGGNTVQTTQFYAERRAFPDVNELEGYKKIAPDFPERLMAKFERESEHRQDQEKTQLNAMIEDTRDERAERKRGQTCAVAAIFLVLSACVWIMVAVPNGFGATAVSVIGGSTILGITVCFVTGRSAQVAPDEGVNEEGG